MKTRRRQLGLTGVELAQRARISPSYVSLIEKGAKVPDEDVAAQLARGLDDDESLYRAWARATRLGLHDLELLNRLEAISRTPAYVSLVESGEELPKLDANVAPSGHELAAADLARRIREVASRLSSPTAPSTGDSPAGPETSPGGRPSRRPEAVEAQSRMLVIPLLPEGADPAPALASSPSVGSARLFVDRALLAGHAPDSLFAYEVTNAAMKHLRGLAAPGDIVVLRRGGGGTSSDRICAVRMGRGIVLSRLLLKDRSLLLLPGLGEPDFETLEVAAPQTLARLVVGTHVLLIRR